LSPLLYYKGIQ